MKQVVILIVAGSMIVTGCSTRPREFNARLDAAPNNAVAFETDLASCRQMVSQGRRDGFKEAAMMAGTGTVSAWAAGAAATGTGVIPIGLGMSTTAGVALLTLMPLAGIGAAVGASRAVRSKKERAIRDAMDLCLAEHGHKVDGWVLAKKTR